MYLKRTKNSSFLFFYFILNRFSNSFYNKPESSRDFTILIISPSSSFDIISVVIFPDPNILLCIPASAAAAAAAAAVNPKGIKTILANGLIPSLLMVILFLVMDQVICQEILPIVSS